MTFSIVYTSNTGNTALLAETILALLPEGSCIYCGAPAPHAAKADLIFAGFWTDKGNCSQQLAAFLESLTEKKIFLFGTAGFGGAEEYFNQIVSRAVYYLKEGNTVIGTYFCQGKMPLSVRARYEAISKTDPAKALSLLENFDRARSHPDTEDLNKLKNIIIDLLKNIQ